MSPAVLELYKRHFVDKQDERLGLFVLLAETFAIRRAMYPGSFVHLTPAFIFPKTCFIDTDRRAARFFNDPEVLTLVRQQKIYPREPSVRFHHSDYAHELEEADGSYDLLISQYAGFVSQSCKRYLRLNGYLMANNSHGDASMASIDEDYALLAAIDRRGDKFSLRNSDLGSYFVPKSEIEITKELLEQTRKGIGYKKSAFSYVFKRIA